MILFVIAFFIGDCYLQTLPQLPSQLILCALIIMSLILCYLQTQWKYSYVIIAAISGFVFTAWYAQSLLLWTLPKSEEGIPMVITGYIASLPTHDRWQTNFLLMFHSRLIRLTWRDPAIQLKVGDRWQLQVKLKRIHSTQNEGTFDFEGWALQKKLRAGGVVLPNGLHRLLQANPYRYPILHLRQRCQNNLNFYAHHLKNTPWIAALMIGEHSGAPEKEWEILHRTGTNHLMAIAGLHIGMIAGLVYAICRRMWIFVPRLSLHYPAHLAASAAALIIAIFYSALAGFSLPTERACIMLACFTMTLLLKVEINKWCVYTCALFLILLLNPLSVLTDSFWLSFGTIGIIIYGMCGRLHAFGWWWKWGRVQWVIGIGLIPLSLILFKECSLISFIANTFSIPWIGFFVLPFCFLGGLFLLISPPIGYPLIVLADKSLTILWTVLAWFSHLPIASIQLALPSALTSLSIIIGIGIFLLPAGINGRWFSMLFLLPLLITHEKHPPLSTIWFTLLDVGQGLSTIVQTENHLLIFDTGPKFENQDSGKNIILPYLQMIGAHHIDMLVVSHGDNDHIGGANALLSAMSVRAIKTSVPEMLETPVTTPCLAGEQWTWDQVHFEFLHPKSLDDDQNNNDSCVLRITSGKQHILLTGDIEKAAEKSLLQNNHDQLPATILIAPHHGSKTSGMRAFIEAVHPQYVLYAIGYRNRYHFPHPAVVETYTQLGVKQLDTAQSGMITFTIEPNKPIATPFQYRIDHHRYWFD
ncbi:MAG: DNA internalization-related competence protein ComEC/Rec2 [Gammaproteobacteria bacterium RIFCSPHIGHO2_12_FULL_42_10]|nr:MAG: DNA internalization-related competence protein ComEC/Rec2 [Gammaproteobacteria bacterium RIFCSPHIGHO2_12_FULL_42_10]